jgi:hypothetical protein
VEEMKIVIVRHEGMVTTTTSKHKKEMELVIKWLKVAKQKFFKM